MTIDSTDIAAVLNTITLWLRKHGPTGQHIRWLVDHPNPDQDGTDLLRESAGQVKEVGTGYVWVVRNALTVPVELRCLPTHRVTAILATDTIIVAPGNDLGCVLKDPVSIPAADVIVLRA